MQIFYTRHELKAFVTDVKSTKSLIGFVPTMGALHQGHLSLVQYAKAETDIAIASIFVNPTQFNNADDLKSYPRNLAKDLAMLDNQGCDIVFVPSEEEMYPHPDKRIFDFDGLDQVMEGEHRPGHFNGVAQIVSKLFEAVEPHKAYFGQKDFQQVAIINKMVEKSGFKTKIIACPIIRENDGLAMSSRNQLLTPEHRMVAPKIFEILNKSLEKWMDFNNIELLENWVINEINKTKLLRVEYFLIVNQNTLLKSEQTNKLNGHIGCIAVWAGKVRLIDNLIYNY